MSFIKIKIHWEVNTAQKQYMQSLGCILYGRVWGIIRIGCREHWYSFPSQWCSVLRWEITVNPRTQPMWHPGRQVHLPKITIYWPAQKGEHLEELWACCPAQDSSPDSWKSLLAMQTTSLQRWWKFYSKWEHFAVHQNLKLHGTLLHHSIN